MENIFNIPDLLNFHIGNPLGLSPVAMLIIIFVLVMTMNVFNYLIRFRDQQQYYPVIYTLFAVSAVAIFYYGFQAGLPEVDGRATIGWFCYSSKVGIGWAIVGVALAAVVAFGMLIAAMQISAQLAVEAKMIEGKKWKEWKWCLGILMLGLTISGIGYGTSVSFAAWMMTITISLVTLFCIVKIIVDTVRNHNFPLNFLAGLAFFLGAVAATIVIVELLHSFVYILVLLITFLAQAKARKKKPSKKD